MKKIIGGLFFCLIILIGCEKAENKENLNIQQVNIDNDPFINKELRDNNKSNDYNGIVDNHYDYNEYLKIIEKNPEDITFNQIITKQISISDEHEVDSNVLKNTSFSKYFISSSGSIYPPWDTTKYPDKIYGTDEKSYPVRPPFSNNTITVQSGEYFESTYYVYDIEKDTFTKLDNVHAVYWALHSEGTIFTMFSPEWTISIHERGYNLVFIDKNHQNILDRENETIHNYLLAEFSGTIFDVEYIIETISQINSWEGWELVTKYGTHFSGGSYYFLTRIQKYFNVHIGELSGLWNMDVYKDGFYFYDANRVIFFSLKENNVVEYKFDKNLSELTKGNNNYGINVSENGLKFYLRILYDSRGRYWNMYEYDL